MENPTPKSTAASRPKLTLQPSRQTCLILGGLMGIFLVAGVGLYFWQSGEIAALDKQVKAKQAQVADGEKIARRLVVTEAAYAESQSTLRNLETSVTAKEYVPTLLRQTEQLAKSVNLQVGSLRPKLEPAPAPPTEKEARKKFVPWPYDKIHIDMEVRGTYWNVAKLINRLTAFPKILALESVQVQTNTASETKGPPLLTVNLKLTGFIFPNDGKGADARTIPASGTDALVPDSGAQASGGGTLDTAKTVVGGVVPKAPPVFGKVGAYTEKSTSVLDAPKPGAPGVAITPQASAGGR